MNPYLYSPYAHVITCFFSIPSKRGTMFYYEKAQKLLANCPAHITLFTSSKHSEVLKSYRGSLPLTLIEDEVMECGLPKLNPISSILIDWDDIQKKLNKDFTCYEGRISVQLLQLWFCKMWFMARASEMYPKDLVLLWNDIGSIRCSQDEERVKFYPRLSLFPPLTEAVYFFQRRPVPLIMNETHYDVRNSVIAAGCMFGYAVMWKQALGVLLECLEKFRTPQRTRTEHNMYYEEIMYLYMLKNYPSVFKTYGEANGNWFQSYDSFSQVPDPPLMQVMIIKNEEKILRRCLEAAMKQGIKYFCICDTGSIDSSCKIVHKFFDEFPYVKGVLKNDTWKNFGHNRTLSFQHAQEFAGQLNLDLTKTWALLLDADMVLVKQSLPLFHKPSYSMYQKNGALTYPNTRFIRLDQQVKCLGVTHEYWDTRGEKETLALERCFIDDRGDGGSKADKFIRDIALLKSGLLQEPKNTRYKFYLANSYRDACIPEKAIKWYTRVLDSDGWIEERCVSAINLVKLTKDKSWAWKAHELNPKRAEGFFHYLSHMRSQDKFSQELYAMALYAASIPLPSLDNLFVQRDVYDWRLKDELSIIASYTGHKEIALLTSEELFKENKFPEEQRQRLEKNKSFFN